MDNDMYGSNVATKGFVMGADEAKQRLKAYAAMKSGNLGLMLPAKKKNKELKKFFDEETEKGEVVKPKPKDSVMDKMAMITEEIEKEKAEQDKFLEKHIRELKRRNRDYSRSKSRSRSRSRARDKGGRRDLKDEIMEE